MLFLSAGRMGSGLLHCEARPGTEKDPLERLNNALPKPVTAGGRAAKLSHDADRDSQWKRKLANLV